MRNFAGTVTVWVRDVVVDEEDPLTGPSLPIAASTLELKFEENLSRLCRGGVVVHPLEVTDLT